MLSCISVKWVGCLLSCTCLLCSFRERDSSEWEGLVAAYRSVLTSDFFAHIENLIRAAHEDPAEQEGELTVPVHL